MRFITAVTICLKKYAGFAGRARRSEYWYFLLFSAVLSIASQIANLDEVVLFLSLVLFLPSLAVSVRRLHDIDRSGWWLLISLIPLVGMIVLIVWACKPGTLGANRFGDDPLESTQLTLPPDA